MGEEQVDAEQLLAKCLGGFARFEVFVNVLANGFSKDGSHDLVTDYMFHRIVHHSTGFPLEH